MNAPMPIFINTKDAAQLLHLNVIKVQGLCKSKYKGFPAILAGNKFLINRLLLDAWAQKVTEEEGTL